MNNTVFFIKNECDEKEYDKNMLMLINKFNFFTNLRKGDLLTLNFNPYDMADTGYITENIIENLKKNISEKQCESKILASKNLYHVNNCENTSQILVNNHIDLDDVYSNNNKVNVSCNQIFESVLIFEEILDNDMIIFTHFKGHPMIGFSGALKNLATSCIGLEGQKELHKLAKPFISKIGCLSCDACVSVCPEEAISVDNYARINQDLCTGCNVCIKSCPNNTIKLNKLNSEEIIRAICEIVNTILNNKKDNKVLFINSLIDINAYYDCNNSEKIIAEEMGILASYNPVALDKACYDLINKNSSEDKFKKIWRNIDGTLQFKISEELGIGSQEYELITI